MRVYHQNILTTKQFIDEVLNYCIGDQNSSLIMLHGLKCIGGVRINIQYKAPSDRSLVESVYSSFKRTKVFSITQYQTH